MSNYDDDVVEAAKALVKAKVRAKGKPAPRTYKDSNGREFTYFNSSWTQAEYALYKAVNSGDS